MRKRRRSGECMALVAAGVAWALLADWWYLAPGLPLLLAGVGLFAGVQRRGRPPARRRQRPGPRDPWLNEVAVALGELGFAEVARNTGAQLGGVAMEGDIGLREHRLLVYVNLFATAELARQAELGLRAKEHIRRALADGRTIVQTLGRVLLVAAAGGAIVDEYRVNEVACALAEVPPPSAPPDRPDPLVQIRRLAELRDAGIVSQAEFEAKKAELLRRV